MIYFLTESTRFVLKDKKACRAWLENIAYKKKHKIEALNYIFCSDEYLHHINRKYLNHDPYTDIITFDPSEEKGVIEGDIFISIDRVKENAGNYKTPFANELYRVMAHGLLHLLGYKDKTPSQQKNMRQMENLCLRSRKF